MLIVRGPGLDRDRPFGQRGDHALERVDPPTPLPPQAEAAALRDRGAQQRVGQKAPRDDPVRGHVDAGFRLGGSGTNTETSAW